MLYTTFVWTAKDSQQSSWIQKEYDCISSLLRHCFINFLNVRMNFTECHIKTVVGCTFFNDKDNSLSTSKIMAFSSSNCALNERENID